MGVNKSISSSKSSWILVLLLAFPASSYSYSPTEKAVKINYHLKASTVMLSAISEERDSEDSDNANLFSFVFNIFQFDIHAASECRTGKPVKEIVGLVFQEQSRMNGP